MTGQRGNIAAPSLDQLTIARRPPADLDRLAQLAGMVVAAARRAEAERPPADETVARLVATGHVNAHEARRLLGQRA